MKIRKNGNHVKLGSTWYHKACPRRPSAAKAWADLLRLLAQRAVASWSPTGRLMYRPPGWSRTAPSWNTIRPR